MNKQRRILHSWKHRNILIVSLLFFSGLKEWHEKDNSCRSFNINHDVDPFMTPMWGAPKFLPAFCWLWKSSTSQSQVTRGKWRHLLTVSRLLRAVGRGRDFRGCVCVCVCVCVCGWSPNHWEPWETLRFLNLWLTSGLWRRMRMPAAVLDSSVHNEPSLAPAGTQLKIPIKPSRVLLLFQLSIRCIAWLYRGVVVQ